ncbi:MAG TPA: DUF1579 family protein [Vicinamibacterales bacterium]|nr:DUF1579 family protein [Vicinamibacterales bacterium]
MRIFLTSAIAAAVFTSGAMAQPPEMKPGAEHKRLAHFVGQWKFEGESKASPMGPAGKWTGTETCEWFAGSFHVVCNSKGTGPMGAQTGHAIMGYDPMEKGYTYYGISSRGEGYYVKGSVSGNVWTWTSEMMMEGKPAKFRVTVTEDSPTAHSFKMEASFGGGPMTVVEEGKSTKISKS